MEDKDLIFYDTEVFKYDTLFVFKDINNKEVAHFWNNQERYEDFSDPVTGFEGMRELVTGHILSGYNNYSYDDYILSAALRGFPQKYIKKLNDAIIKGQGSSIRVLPEIKSIDTMQQIDVSHPSLKQIEGNMGKSIIETSIDFTTDHPLSDEEREEVLKYCRYDVESTIAVYNLRKKSYFETKENIIKMLPEDKQEKAGHWNTTTISATILNPKGTTHLWLGHRVPLKYWRQIDGIPESVWEMWEEATASPDAATQKGRSKTVHELGCSIVFGMGGLHGAPKKPGIYENIKLADVSSMYPSIICSLGALEDSTPVYDQMRRERIAIKHKDKTKASALKLILNSVYGNFKNRYSTLYNPLASSTVCIYGQIAIFSLSKALYDAGYEIVNINTDGVAFVDRSDLSGRYEEICRKWEEEFEGLKLDVDEFDKWIQKDVNNYIAVSGDHIKTKGGETNKYQQDKFFSNNSARIIQIAMVEKLLHNTDPLITMTDYLDKPLYWQYILKAGGTYKGVQNAAGEWQNKVNRVFAANDSVESTTLYKIRQDDGRVNFPDAPQRMYLWNDSVDKLADRFKSIVDLDHYYRLIKEKLKGWPNSVY